MAKRIKKPKVKKAGKVRRHTLATIAKISRSLARSQGPTPGYDDYKPVGRKAGKGKGKASKPGAGKVGTVGKARPAKGGAPKSGSPQAKKATSPAGKKTTAKETTAEKSPLKATQPDQGPSTNRSHLPADIRKEQRYKSDLDDLRSRLIEGEMSPKDFVELYKRKMAAAKAGDNAQAKRDAARLRTLGEDTNLIDKRGNPIADEKLEQIGNELSAEADLARENPDYLDAFDDDTDLPELPTRSKGIFTKPEKDRDAKADAPTSDSEPTPEPAAKVEAAPEAEVAPEPEAPTGKPKVEVPGGGRRANPDFLKPDAIRQEPGYDRDLDSLKRNLYRGDVTPEGFKERYERKKAQADVDQPRDSHGGHGRNRSAAREVAVLYAHGVDAGILDPKKDAPEARNRPPASPDGPRTPPPSTPRTAVGGADDGERPGTPNTPEVEGEAPRKGGLRNMFRRKERAPLPGDPEKIAAAVQRDKVNAARRKVDQHSERVFEHDSDYQRNIAQNPGTDQHRPLKMKHRAQRDELRARRHQALVANPNADTKAFDDELAELKKTQLQERVYEDRRIAYARRRGANPNGERRKSAIRKGDPDAPEPKTATPEAEGEKPEKQAGPTRPQPRAAQAFQHGEASTLPSAVVNRPGRRRAEDVPAPGSGRADRSDEARPAQRSPQAAMPEPETVEQRSHRRERLQRYSNEQLEKGLDNLQEKWGDDLDDPSVTYDGDKGLELDRDRGRIQFLRSEIADRQSGADAPTGQGEPRQLQASNNPLRGARGLKPANRDPNQLELSPGPETEGRAGNRTPGDTGVQARTLQTPEDARREAEARAILEMRGQNTDDWDAPSPEVSALMDDARARVRQQHDERASMLDATHRREAEGRAVLEARGVDTSEWEEASPAVRKRMDAARKRVADDMNKTPEGRRLAAQNDPAEVERREAAAQEAGHEFAPKEQRDKFASLTDDELDYERDQIRQEWGNALDEDAPLDMPEEAMARDVARERRDAIDKELADRKVENRSIAAANRQAPNDSDPARDAPLPQEPISEEDGDTLDNLSRLDDRTLAVIADSDSPIAADAGRELANREDDRNNNPFDADRDDFVGTARGRTSDKALREHDQAQESREAADFDNYLEEVFQEAADADDGTGMDHPGMEVLEKMEVDKKLTPKERKAITAFLDNKDPFRQNGEVNRLLDGGTLPQVRKALRDRGHGDLFDDDDIADRMAMAGNPSPSIRKRSGQYRDAYHAWVEKYKQERLEDGTVHDRTEVNALNGKISFDEAIANPMAAHKATDEVETLFQEKGYLPTEQNFSNMLAGRPMVTYESRDGARERGYIGGTAKRRSRAEVNAERERKERLRSMTPEQRKKFRAENAAKEEEFKAKVRAQNERIEAEKKAKAEAAAKPVDTGTPKPAHPATQAKDAPVPNPKDLKTGYAKLDADRKAAEKKKIEAAKAEGADMRKRARAAAAERRKKREAEEAKKAKAAAPKPKAQAARPAPTGEAKQDQLPVPKTHPVLGGKGKRVTEAEAAEEMYGTNSPEHHRAKVAEAKRVHGNGSPEHGKAKADAAKPRPKQAPAAKPAPKGEQGTLPGVENSAASTVDGDRELPGIDAVTLSNQEKPKPKATAPKADAPKANAPKPKAGEKGPLKSADDAYMRTFNAVKAGKGKDDALADLTDGELALAWVEATKPSTSRGGTHGKATKDRLAKAIQAERDRRDPEKAKQRKEAAPKPTPNDEVPGHPGIKQGSREHQTLYRDATRHVSDGIEDARAGNPPGDIAKRVADAEAIAPKNDPVRDRFAQAKAVASAVDNLQDGEKVKPKQYAQSGIQIDRNGKNITIVNGKFRVEDGFGKYTDHDTMDEARKAVDNINGKKSPKKAAPEPAQKAGRYPDNASLPEDYRDDADLTHQRIQDPDLPELGTPERDSLDIAEVARYMSTPEAKAAFRETSNREHRNELPRDSANGYAFQDAARAAVGHRVAPIDTLQDSFEWRRIANTKDPKKIEKYLREAFDIPEVSAPEVKPKASEAPKPKAKAPGKLEATPKVEAPKAAPKAKSAPKAAVAPSVGDSLRSKYPDTDKYPDPPEGKVAVSNKTFRGRMTAKDRRYISDHAQGLSNRDLKKAYEEARAEVNSDGGVQGVRNAYADEVNDRGLAMEGGPSKGIHGKPRTWDQFLKPYGDTSTLTDEAWGRIEERYRRSLMGDGMSREDADARIKELRSGAPEKPKVTPKKVTPQPGEHVPYHQRPEEQRAQDMFDDFVAPEGGISRLDMANRSGMPLGAHGAVGRMYNAGWITWERSPDGDMRNDRLIPTRKGLEASKARKAAKGAKGARQMIAGEGAAPTPAKAAPQAAPQELPEGTPTTKAGKPFKPTLKEWESPKGEKRQYVQNWRRLAGLKVHRTGARMGNPGTATSFEHGGHHVTPSMSDQEGQLALHSVGNARAWVDGDGRVHLDRFNDNAYFTHDEVVQRIQAAVNAHTGGNAKPAERKFSNDPVRNEMGKLKQAESKAAATYGSAMARADELSVNYPNIPEGDREEWAEAVRRANAAELEEFEAAVAIGNLRRDNGITRGERGEDSYYRDLSAVADGRRRHILAKHAENEEQIRQVLATGSDEGARKDAVKEGTGPAPKLNAEERKAQRAQRLPGDVPQELGRDDLVNWETETDVYNDFIDMALLTEGDLLMVANGKGERARAAKRLLYMKFKITEEDL